MKRARSLSVSGRALKRRRAMTKEEAVAYTTQASTAVVPRSLVPRGMPKSMTVKLKYYEAVAVNPISGAISSIGIRANSCFDPYVNTGGHQPKGMDQYFALYDTGVVIASRISVKLVSATAGDMGIFGVSLRNDATYATTILEYVEDPKCSWAISGNVSTVNQEVVNDYRPSWFGPGIRGMNDDELHFTAGADAEKQAYFHVFYGPANTSLDAPGATLEIMTEYTIKFFEPNTLPSS